jgi:hypothetical protein
MFIHRLNLPAVVLACAAVGTATAQNQEFPGYIGVYVNEGNFGMQIANFIRQTPAARLANTGNISVGETIVRLAGMDTQTLQELRQARNRIPYGREGKMILRRPNGTFHTVWISRNEPVAAAPAGRFGAAAPTAAAPDEFRAGSEGRGDNDPDIRDIPAGSAPPRGDGPDIR